MKKCLVICLLSFINYAQAFEAIWSRSGAQDSSHYGYDILPLGDQNNDGFADWAVTADGNAGYNNSQASYVEFFHGGNPPSTTPYMSQHFPHPRNPSGGGLLFASVLGDVNDDGYTDWGFISTGPLNTQIYYFSIYLGGPSADSIPDAQLVRNGNGAFRGLGDFNGDGYGDWFRYQDYPLDYLQIFYGGAVLDTIPDLIIYSRPGEPQSSRPGYVGDLNGDGYSDFVTYDFDPNNTFIFLGGANPDTLPAYIWPNLAYSPTGVVNDINGNLCDELVFSYSGGAAVYYGRNLLSNAVDANIDFPCAGGARPVVSLGDINHDGYKDMALVEGDCPHVDFGVLSIYLGHPWLNPQPAVTIYGGDWQSLRSLQTATGLGDVDGDGVDDWAIGAYDYLWYIGWCGRCIVIKGDTTLVAGAEAPFILPPSSFILSAYPNPFNATTTISFTLPKTGSVDLNVYDVTGRLVRRLAGGHMGPPLQAGEHQIAFDGSNLSSGIYFVRMEAGGISQTQKIVLLK